MRCVQYLLGRCNKEERGRTPTMTEQRILIVDDSRVIVQMIRKVLDDTGYEVFTAESGEQALDLIKKRGLPHLALIDINMPGMDGFTLCEKIHRFSDLPIIMITSEDSEEMVVEGLQLHAEDYVIKPIRQKEIVARVQRVLRRMGDFGYTLAEPTIDVDKRMQVRLAHREVILDGETVKLTPIEAKFMYILMRHAGRTVSTEYIFAPHLAQRRGVRRSPPRRHLPPAAQNRGKPQRAHLYHF